MSNLPPCFLVTSHDDHLRQYTVDFTNALRRNSVACELLDFGPDKRLTHAFSVFNPEFSESQEVFHQLARYLNSI